MEWTNDWVVVFSFYGSLIGDLNYARMGRLEARDHCHSQEDALS